MFPKEIFYISRRVCGRGSGQLNRILLLRPSFHFSQILFESVVKLLSPLCLISLTTTRNFSNLFVSVLVCTQLSNWNTYISMWFLYRQINWTFCCCQFLPWLCFCYCPSFVGNMQCAFINYIFFRNSNFLLHFCSYFYAYSREVSSISSMSASLIYLLIVLENPTSHTFFFSHWCCWAKIGFSALFCVGSPIPKRRVF